MMLPEQERPVAIPKGQIRERRISNVSAMPEDLLNPYDLNDIANLLAYMQSVPAQ